MGDLEYTFLRAQDKLQEPGSQMHPCRTYLTNFTTIQQLHSDYHQRGKDIFPILNYTIFSYAYSEKPFLHGSLTTHTLDINNLQARLEDRVRFHKLVWSNARPRYLRMLQTVCLYEFIQEEKTRFTFEYFKYSHSNNRYHNKNAFTYYHRYGIVNRNSLLRMFNYFDLMVYNMGEHAVHIYSIQLTLLMMQFLQTTFSLQSNVIQQHSFDNGNFFSIPLYRIIYTDTSQHLALGQTHAPIKINSTTTIEKQTNKYSSTTRSSSLQYIKTHIQLTRNHDTTPSSTMVLVTSPTRVTQPIRRSQYSRSNTYTSEVTMASAITPSTEPTKQLTQIANQINARTPDKTQRPFTTIREHLQQKYSIPHFNLPTINNIQYERKSRLLIRNVTFSGGDFNNTLVTTLHTFIWRLKKIHLATKTFINRYLNLLCAS